MTASKNRLAESPTGASFAVQHPGGIRARADSAYGQIWRIQPFSLRISTGPGVHEPAKTLGPTRKDNARVPAGPRPCMGSRTASTFNPLRTMSHEMTEFEFHISPVLELVASPNRRRHRLYDVENPLCGCCVFCEALRALDRFADVGKDPVAQASDLVAKELEPACGTRSDGSLSHHASVGRKVLPCRPLLDDVSGHRCTHDERRVVEITAITAANPCRDCLEDAPVQPH